MAIEFKNLMELDKPVFGQCSAVLPNKMQCYRAAAYQVTEKYPHCPDSVYHLCTFHTRLKMQTLASEVQRPSESAETSSIESKGGASNDGASS